MELLAPELFPFSLSVGIVAALGLVELIAIWLGGGALTHALNWDAPHFNFELPLPDALDWISVKGLPLSLYLVLFLGFFGVSGMFVQGVASLIGGYMPLGYAVTGSLFWAVLGSRLAGTRLVKLFASEETAVSSNDLIGLRGTVLSPLIEYGKPGEVRVNDKHGNAHYLWCEPLTPSESLHELDLVYIKSVKEHLYFISKN